MTADPTPPRRIGVLVTQLEDAYQAAIWLGIKGRALARGFGVTCMVSPVEEGDSAKTRDSLAFRIITPEAFDGLILLSTTIGPIPENCQRLPRVSLGLKLPGVPSVTVDGGPGLGDLVRHLVRDHGRRNFAVLTGPEAHNESQERLAAIRDALAGEGLTLDPRLIVGGNFYEAPASEATRRLLASGVPFDALMALNDRMAFGALQTLRDAGILVPDQVSVTGFDNVEQGRAVAPPLTTIDQPLDVLGALAVDMLVDLFEGRAAPDWVLPCRPVRRWSCGCPPRTEDFLPHPPDPTSRGPETLKALLTQNDGPGFLSELARHLGTEGLGAREAQTLVDTLETSVAPQGPPLPLAEAGRRLAAEVATRIQAAHRHMAVERFAAVRSLSARLAGSFGREALLEGLREGLAGIGVRRGYLVLFEAPAQALHPGLGRLILPGDSDPFPSVELLPQNYGHPWSKGVWIFEPLVYQEEPLGYLLLEGTADEIWVYAALRDQVASTLKGTQLMESLRDHEKSLGEQVALRTRQLTRSNKELTQEVSRRRDLEKQVREISDRTMRRIGQDLHDDLCQHLAGVAMLATVVRRSLEETPEEAGPALDRIGALLEDSIIRTRQIARGLYPPSLEERGLADAVEELVARTRLTSPILLVYETEGDCRGGDPDRRLQMFRIIQESLANALKHSGTDVVRIELTQDPDGDITATVTDFGQGLAPVPGGSGLGLGIMRHRAESAGLELRFEALSPGLRVVCRWPSEEKNHG